MDLDDPSDSDDPFPTYHEVRFPLTKSGVGIFFIDREKIRAAPNPETYLVDLLCGVQKHRYGHTVLLGDPSTDPWFSSPRYTPNHSRINALSRRYLAHIHLGAHLYTDENLVLTNQKLDLEELRIHGEGMLRFRLCSALDAVPLDPGAIYCVSANGIAEPREQHANHICINDRHKGIRIFSPEFDSGWLKDPRRAIDFSTELVRYRYIDTDPEHVRFWYDDL